MSSHDGVRRRLRAARRERWSPVWWPAGVTAAFAYLVSETRATRQWAEGERDIGSTEREQRLRAAAHVTRLIAETFDARTAQAWMQGMDPMLDDRPPAWVLRHATEGTERVAVLASARRFIVQ